MELLTPTQDTTQRLKKICFALCRWKRIWVIHHGRMPEDTSAIVPSILWIGFKRRFSSFKAISTTFQFSRRKSSSRRFIDNTREPDLCVILEKTTSLNLRRIFETCGG